MNVNDLSTFVNDPLDHEHHRLFRDFEIAVECEQIMGELIQFINQKKLHQVALDSDRVYVAATLQTVNRLLGIPTVPVVQLESHGLLLEPLPATEGAVRDTYEFLKKAIAEILKNIGDWFNRVFGKTQAASKVAQKKLDKVSKAAKDVPDKDVKQTTTPKPQLKELIYNDKITPADLSNHGKQVMGLINKVVQVKLTASSLEDVISGKIPQAIELDKLLIQMGCKGKDNVYQLDYPFREEIITFTLKHNNTSFERIERKSNGTQPDTQSLVASLDDLIQGVDETHKVLAAVEQLETFHRSFSMLTSTQKKLARQANTNVKPETQRFLMNQASNLSLFTGKFVGRLATDAVKYGSIYSDLMNYQIQRFAFAPDERP